MADNQQDKLIGRYEASFVPGINEHQSKVQPDEAGYYPVILGALNVQNTSGQFYPMADSVKKLFTGNSTFKKYLDRGCLKSEYGHPNLTGYKTEREILGRLAFMDEKHVCAHIKQVDLLERRNDMQRLIYLVKGMVKPSGPYASCLIDHFNNREENVCFSVRNFINPNSPYGSLQITDIITWDYVTMGGISQASKYNSIIALEQFNFSPRGLDEAIAYNTARGLENDVASLTMVKDGYGWNKLQLLNIDAGAGRIFNWKL